MPASRHTSNTYALRVQSHRDLFRSMFTYQSGEREELARQSHSGQDAASLGLLTYTRSGGLSQGHPS